MINQTQQALPFISPQAAAVELDTRQQAVSPLAKRREARDAAYDAANDRWRECYSAYILGYLREHGASTAEDIRLAYAKTDLPKTDSQRASGGIFTRLIRSGKIEAAGMERSKIFGNFLVKYRRAK